MGTVDIAAAAEATKRAIEDKAERETQARDEKQRIDAIKKQNAEDDARIAAEEKRRRDADKGRAEKEAEAQRKEKAEAKIRANAEAVRNKQEAQESLAAMKRDAATRQASEKARVAEEEILRSTKTTSAQRIAARNRIDAMTRAENKRIEDANARITQPNKFRAPDMKKITPGTIRASISSAAGRAPAKISNITTGMFGGIADTMIQQPSNKGFTKFYKQESQAMSKAVKGHAKMPVTGGKVTPVLKGTQVAVAPGYIDALLGRGGAVRTHTKKSGGVFSGLDNFVRRI